MEGRPIQEFAKAQKVALKTLARVLALLLSEACTRSSIRQVEVEAVRLEVVMAA